MLIYILLFLFLIAVAILMLHLRIIFRLSKDEKLLFAGLGRSGSEFDLSSKTGTLKLFGFNITKFKLFEEKDKPKKKKEEKKATKAKKKRTRSFIEGIKLIPRIFDSSKKFIFSIFNSIIVEELDGEIKAGFTSPNITGQVYGYYQAVSALIPNFNNRFTFSPIWNESTFDGRLNATISLPLYKLIYRSLIFIISLPFVKIYVFIRGKKKGGRNG